jgi:peptidoglycan/xylan/chitin deacetylase (PgdA/CDA1 family)
LTVPYRHLTKRRLRIVAFHEVFDGVRFTELLDELLRNYRPVSGADVVAAIDGVRPLPAGAVWLTFDDGYSSVVSNALGPLLERGAPATLFVCPGLVESGQPPWWEIVMAASTTGWSVAGATGEAAVSMMKRLPDVERRRILAAASDALGGRSVWPDPIADHRALERWLSAGLELGNHSWDHPCLDTATPEEQSRQIVSAHRWLASRGAFGEGRPPLFAYPNGGVTSHAQRQLDQCGYRAAVAFDHRLTRVGPEHRFSLSRLRLDADAGTARARAVSSGLHAGVFQLLRRFKGWR